MDHIVKVCSCGREYTQAEWRELNFAGRQLVAGLPLIERRECAECKSSCPVYLDGNDRVIPANADGDPILPEAA